MVRSPYVFQVVGYQNSGKTTLVKKIITHLKKHDLTAATVKHHGHGGKPNLLETKDSSQHISSGALAAIVEGDGRILLQAEKMNWTLDEQLVILMQFNPDFIIIEGHKHASFPKFVLLKDIEDSKLLSVLSNIKVVLYWSEETSTIQDEFPSLPFFSIHDNAGEEWIINYLINQHS
ncbi:molybdopterin-guanine dinucleotide biosynthesis protein B [Bacillus sp. DTU_2020_1000418_1_SI_GHA_SEK_038]|uniref:molybdopterin-guanine dinucleotide biosynthesis protein B n=1 Tax=Bacillus sp. DTU_2020_1000418_1_SI_GHA_SEK_038 TaxID=3077585 RepID=UPI0028EC8B32|nr:molybdopterin-guanine dinucleotide biosynthesis protein B [Bacillus sp. DTU_2020_1000418_1_SI_GHA_SEK_038]WNS76842.1 molybdopterin-guanine dinucleotide biosynthesis protein B [Bacillus sp. DTU_2020_1000418_1_SI_GHA_SEK_038]